MSDTSTHHAPASKANGEVPVVAGRRGQRVVPDPPGHVQAEAAAAGRAGRVDHDPAPPDLRPRRRVRLRQVDHRTRPAAPAEDRQRHDHASTARDITDAQVQRSSCARCAANMQMVFQDPYSSLDPSSVIADIIGEPLRVHEGIKGKARDDRVRELLRHVGLSPTYTERYPYEFSGGQRQRIAIARAIALNPKLIVLDEAVSALDVSTQNQILELLEQLRDDLGVAYLFISHNLSVIRWLADRTAVMYLGRIVEEGPTERVYANPAHPYTESLLSAVPVPDPVVQRGRAVASSSPATSPTRCTHRRAARSAPAASTPWTSAPRSSPSTPSSPTAAAGSPATSTRRKPGTRTDPTTQEPRRTARHDRLTPRRHPGDGVPTMSPRSARHLYPCISPTGPTSSHLSWVHAQSGQDPLRHGVCTPGVTGRRGSGTGVVGGRDPGRPDRTAARQLGGAARIGWRRSQDRAAGGGRGRHVDDQVA